MPQGPGAAAPPPSRRAWRGWRLTPGHMRLSTRLILIIGTSLLPILAMQAAVGWSQWSERKAQVGAIAVQQAQLLAGNLEGIAQGARILLGAATESPEVRQIAPGCDRHLARLRRHAQGYAFIALVDHGGKIACSSDPGPALQGDEGGWITAARAADRFTAGRYTRIPGFQDAVLPFYLPVEVAGPAAGATLVAALDLAWLEQALQRMKRAGSPFLAGGILTLADAEGVVLARDIRNAEFVGQPLPSAAAPMLSATRPGTLQLRSIDGTTRLVGYTPPTPENHHIATAVGFEEHELLRDIERALTRGTLILLAGALLALGLTLLVGRRFITRPTEGLLQAAQRWRGGDLAARASGADAHSEFGQLAGAFNGMAAALQQREEELRQHALVLEARVAERTAALQHANARLEAEIQERRSTEAALLQAQKLQAVGQLAGGIAHDFNNVLQAVLGGVALIGKRAGDPEAVARLTGMVEEAAKRGQSITRRLLAFSRREELRADRLDVAALLAGLREVLAATLGARIRVEIRAPAGVPPVLADRGQLETVLVNLATNARDAMEQGGRLTLSAEPVTVGPEDPGGLAPGDYVRVAVKDTGSGMDAATLARAGEPFFTTKPAGKGTGLGLAMARGFAEGSGGRMRIQSAPGQGTCIALWLPRAAEAEASAPGPVPRAAPAPSSAAVLLVDDEPAVRAVLSEHLAEAGYRVTALADGAAALDRLRAGQRCDLLVSDLAMEGMDGVTLIREARRLRPGLPAILLTGYAGDAASLAVGQEVDGGFTLLRKPVTAAQLTDQVAALLGAQQVG
ncbi:hybrid sensor histidine kinase/response regulator [Paracraurococcus lichenis]|uniref:histidine kinase n=1 Tax=Paracraurococcus lichenis TaxID=3064888 RepID=A0ABT9DT08_9PROT|nr:ATP-binding protein [Paracraurococcus sp. LOR1-02]MDO9707032.1 response regulator [Paracraurococcus sp. LOR1-02]